MIAVSIGDPARGIVHVGNLVAAVKATRWSPLTAAIRVKQCSTSTAEALVRDGNYLTLSLLEVSVGFEQSDGRLQGSYAELCLMLLLDGLAKLLRPTTAAGFKRERQVR